MEQVGQQAEESRKHNEGGDLGAWNHRIAGLRR